MNELSNFNSVTNNIVENVLVSTEKENLTVYEVCQNINTLLSVLCFTIIIIFLFKYLKSCFKYKG